MELFNVKLSGAKNIVAKIASFLCNRRGWTEFLGIHQAPLERMMVAFALAVLTRDVACCHVESSVESNGGTMQLALKIARDLVYEPACETMTGGTGLDEDEAPQLRGSDGIASP
jgi:hypothetical protein